MQRSRDNYREDRSVGELLGDLYRGASQVISLEIELAKTEMSQKASRVGKNVGFLAAGGAIAYAGFLALIFAIIAILATFMPIWLAALIVALVVLAIGGVLVWSGLKTLQQESPAPQRTIQTLKED
ncbi:MAG: phage holin family protein, partial [Actinomycetota bacterium]|nr:phage holin family protein [Actinomycetota bacterium]